MANSIIKVSDDTLKLQGFLSKQKYGAELSFNYIEAETGVEMNTYGKARLRSALYRGKIEYASVPKYGIKIVDTKTVMPLLAHKLGKIDNAVKRAARSHKNVERVFFDKLTPPEQKQILFLGAVFGAIRVTAENGRMNYSKGHILTNTGVIDYKMK